VSIGQPMHKTSRFEFVGEIHPKDRLPWSQIEYNLDRAKGTLKVRLNGPSITISFIEEFEIFEDVYSETFEFMQAILSVLTLRTGIPTRLIITEWTETPISPIAADGMSHPVSGRVYHEQSDQTQVTGNSFMTGLAEGLSWALDLDVNPFLRRAILDFNYALQHPLNDVPIYLSRSIESAEEYFGGERQLIDTLKVSSQVKFVKHMANNAQEGIHARHAAKTATIKQLTQKEVLKAVIATQEVLQLFQIESRIRRERKAGSGL
jgi:hypothetical protein